MRNQLNAVNKVADKSAVRMVGWMLLLFALAAWTGVLFRWTMLNGPLWSEASLDFIRHAHSHLMFFAWAVPVPIWLMIQLLKRSAISDTQLRLLRRGWYVILLLGLSTYPFFLLYGYGSVAIGEARIPLAAVLSGINMIGWYVFAGLYYQIRKQLPEQQQNGLIWFDAAWIMLIVSSLGAWGVSVVQFGGIESARLGKGLTHFFLATFTEGWCLLTALGAMQYYFNLEVGRLNRYALYGILFGAPLTFPLGMSPGLLTPPLLISGRIGALMIGIALAIWLVDIIRARQRTYKSWVNSLWLGLVGIKALALLTAAFIPGKWWMGQHGLNILYLHITLLGVFSIAYWITLSSQLQQQSTGRVVIVSAMAVLISLIPLSSLWPISWTGSWIYKMALWTALLPALITSGWAADLLMRSTTEQIVLSPQEKG